jgi:cell wall assembly regulator SMI1
MSIPAVLNSLRRRPGASEEAIQGVERELGLTLPPDYREFLVECDGIEGFIDSEAYIELWAVDEIAALNKGYAVREFLPHTILLGTSGGGTAYGFMLTTGKYVSVPFVPMDPDEVVSIGNKLTEALEDIRLRN